MERREGLGKEGRGGWLHLDSGKQTDQPLSPTASPGQPRSFNQ